MARYIDAKGMEEWMRKAFKESMPYLLPTFIQMVRCQPTADVQEVVRCKDCKYFTHYRCKPAGTERVICALNGLTDGENDYCSYGERR